METLAVQLINEHSFDKKALVGTFESHSNLCYFITEKFAISFYDSRCYCNLFSKKILGVETAINKGLTAYGYYRSFSINKIVGDMDNELKEYLSSAETMTIATSVLDYLKSIFPEATWFVTDTDNKRLMKSMDFKVACMYMGTKYHTIFPACTGGSSELRYVAAKKETEKAILFIQGGYLGFEFWCPKSIIKNNEIPFWFYNKASASK